MSMTSFVGNARAVRRMNRFAAGFSADPKPCIALVGPSSTGKTMLARLYARQCKAPFIEIQPHAVAKVGDVYQSIVAVTGRPSWSTRRVRDCVVFIDEVHALKTPVVHGLLKAIENSDRMLVTEDSMSISTAGVSWLIATTDRGLLFDAFDSRFDKVQLRMYSKLEVARIVEMANPGLPWHACEMVSRYAGLIPREALAFARELIAEIDASGDTAEVAARRVADENLIDEHGMSHARLAILTALGREPVAAARLGGEAHVKKEELERFLLPPLLARTPDRQIPLVTVSSKGYSITPAGLEELDKRGIINNGPGAMPPSVRSKYA